MILQTRQSERKFTINFLAISGDSQQFVFSNKKTKKSTPGGQGVPPKFVLPQILSFCDLKPNTKFRNPTITTSGRKVTAPERRERKNAVYSAHLGAVQVSRDQAGRRGEYDNT